MGGGYPPYPPPLYPPLVQYGFGLDQGMEEKKLLLLTVHKSDYPCNKIIVS